MASSQSLGRTAYFFLAAAVAILGIGWLVDNLGPDTLLAIPKVAVRSLAYTKTFWRTTSAFNEHQYQIQIFSKDPLIIIIDPFVTSDEIAYLLRLSEDKFTTSLVYGGGESRFDPEKRISESAALSDEDSVVRRIEQRAKNFQGWRGNRTVIQKPTVQRYQVDGFFDYHYDWEPTRTKGNRATTFMVYLVADCTGGGTPSLLQDNSPWQGLGSFQERPPAQVKIRGVQGLWNLHKS